MRQRNHVSFAQNEDCGLSGRRCDRVVNFSHFQSIPAIPEVGKAQRRHINSSTGQKWD